MTVTLILTTLALSPVQTWELEDDDGEFVSAGDTNQWEWGPVESGPKSSHDGSSAWATVTLPKSAQKNNRDPSLP